MVIKRNHEEEKGKVKECGCKNCHGNCKNCGCNDRKKPSKKKFLLVALVLGGLVGAVVGAKYHSELTKAAVESLKAADKNKKKYAKLSNKKLDKLSKDFRKTANKVKKK